MASAQVSDETTEYHSASSRTSSIDSSGSRRRANLSPLAGDGRQRGIGVSSNTKRQFKDKRIYVNPRTGLPVRPPTSFGLFKHTLRRSMKSGKVSFAEFNRKATEKWSRLSESEKEQYSQRAKELSDQFKRIEVSCLRKKVRQLLNQVKDYRQSARALPRRR